MNQLNGTKILITGGGRGIGLAIAEALIDQERSYASPVATKSVYSTSRHSSKLAGQMSLRGRLMTRHEECLSAVADLMQRWGRIDGLVNNSGIYKGAAFLDFKPEDFEALFSTNVMGSIHMMQAVLPHMVAQRSGRVLNVSSIAGKWGTANQSAYNISKHAVVGLTRCVALEMARHGITVNAICPGLVETEMAQVLVTSHAAANGTNQNEMMATILGRVPLGRMVTPAEVASLAAYMLSPAAAGMTGQSVVYDGGVLLV